MGHGYGCDYGCGCGCGYGYGPSRMFLQDIDNRCPARMRSLFKAGFCPECSWCLILEDDHRNSAEREQREECGNQHETHRIIRHIVAATGENGDSRHRR